jgi:hypothetical protein
MSVVVGDLISKLKAGDLGKEELLSQLKSD